MTTKKLIVSTGRLFLKLHKYLLITLYGSSSSWSRVWQETLHRMTSATPLFSVYGCIRLFYYYIIFYIIIEELFWIQSRAHAKNLIGTIQKISVFNSLRKRRDNNTILVHLFIECFKSRYKFVWANVPSLPK